MVIYLLPRNDQIFVGGVVECEYGVFLFPPMYLLH